MYFSVVLRALFLCWVQRVPVFHQLLYASHYAPALVIVIGVFASKHILSSAAGSTWVHFLHLFMSHEQVMGKQPLKWLAVSCVVSLTPALFDPLKDGLLTLEFVALLDLCL